MKRKKLTKRIVSLVMMLAMVLTAIPLGAMNFKVSAEKYDIYTYEVSDGAVTITDCNEGASGAITIPDKIGGYPVTSIGDYAFNECTGLTSITITDSVTSIGHNAFYGCSSLTKITIENSVTSIGVDVFYGTGYYDDESNWDNGVLYIDNCLIQCDTSKSGTYYIKDGTRVISDRAFNSCTDLTSVTIPDSVTSIGVVAFMGCNGLSSITIPYSVTSLGHGAFYDCSSLTEITIGNSVTSIGDSAFHNCSSLTSVTIGSSVASIGYDAFYNCYRLTSITIPDSVTSIVDSAFDACYCLSDVYYGGNESDRAKITIGDCNNYLTNATWHYGKEETNYTATFDANGGVASAASKVVESGAAIGDLPTAEREGYAFNGWYSGSTKVTAETKVTENVTYSAKWTANSYTVKFFDGDALLGSKTLKYDESGTLSYGAVPHKKGYNFIGWSIVNGGPALYNEGMPVLNLKSENGAAVSYYAVWEEGKSTTLKDDNTGIEIVVPDGTYTDDVTLEIKEVITGSVFDIVEKIDSPIKSSVYSIETYVSGVKTQPDGFVSVKIPVPAGFNGAKCKLYYINTDKNVAEEIPVTYEDGYLIFTTNHFSDWAVVERQTFNSISIGDISMNYKSSAKINPSIDADDGAEYTVKYSSSNNSVATVDNNGNVYAAGKGSATITCTATDSNGNTVTDTCTVTVKYSFLQWIIKILLFGWIWY